MIVIFELSPNVCHLHSFSLVGTYSCLYVEFGFMRQYTYYITRIYIPCTLVIGLSWVSFFLDPDAVPGRVSLGLLTILSMSSQLASTMSALPEVGIDVLAL